MKTPYWLVVITCLTIFSCKKDNTTNSSGFDYTVTSVQDIAIQQGGTTNVTWNIKRTKGVAELVRIKLSGLPTDVVSVNDVSDGTPDYKPYMDLKAMQDVPIGSYPITLTTSSTSTTPKTYQFNLLITSSTDCSLALLGRYNATSSCGNAYGATIVEGGNPSTVIINNFAGLGGDCNVAATLNCNNNTLTIPTQVAVIRSYKNVSVQGTGTFTASSLTVNYIYYSDSNVHNCSTVLNKQ